MTLPSSRPPALALALGAVALAAVITLAGVFLLGLGPFAPALPEPSNSPFAQPTSHPTTVATNATSTSTSALPSAPGSAPSGSPDASPALSQPPTTPSSATDALLAHVPEALRPSCTPGSFQQPGMALVSCVADGGAITVSYTLYADQPSMAGIYDLAVIAAGIDDNSGRCYNRNDAGEITVTTSRWPSENGYDIQDEPVGRYLCHDDGTIATLTWTDDHLYILANASADKTAADRLISFWIDEAGPI